MLKKITTKSTIIFEFNFIINNVKELLTITQSLLLYFNVIYYILHQ